MKVTIPGDNTIAKHVARFIFKNGPQTIENCVEMLIGRGYSRGTSSSSIGRMLTHLQLWQMHDKLVLNDQLIRHYRRDNSCVGQIVPAAQPVPFKPLNMKHIPVCRANRDDAGECVPHTFYTSGTSPETLIRGAA